MTSCSAKPYEGHEEYIFVSYCHKDKQKVYPVIERLAREGFRIWYDEGINPGSEWPEIIAEHLTGCAICLAMISDNAMNSHNCRREINYAILKKKPFISIVLENVALSPGMMMQLSTEQSLRMCELSDEAFYNKLLHAPLMASSKEISDEGKKQSFKSEEEGTAANNDSFSDKWFLNRKKAAEDKGKKVADRTVNTTAEEPKPQPVAPKTAGSPSQPKPRRRRLLIAIPAIALAAVLAVSAAVIIPAVNRANSGAGSSANTIPAPGTSVETQNSVPNENSAAAPTTKPELSGIAKQIEDVKKQMSTFEVDNFGFFATIVNGHAKWYKLLDDGIKEYTLNSPQNSDIVSVGFTGASDTSRRVIGLKSDGTVVVLNPSEGQADAFNGWTDVVKIACDSDSVVGLRKDGTVLISTRNTALFDDIQSTWTGIEDIFVDFYVFGLREDGKIIVSDPDKMPEYKSWLNTAAVAPHNSNIGLQWDGMITCTNLFFPDHLSDAKYWEDVIGVDSYAFNTKESLVCLKSDGTVAAIGGNNYGQGNVSDWKNIVAVKTCKNYTIGKMADGHFVIASNNKKLTKAFDETINKTTADMPATVSMQGNLSGKIKLANEQARTFAYSFTVFSDKTCNAFAYIDNNHRAHLFTIEGSTLTDETNLLSNNENLSTIIFGDSGYSIVGLKTDGTVAFLYTNGNGISADAQKEIAGWKNITRIAGGGGYLLGVKDDGTVVTAGDPSTPVLNVKNWTDIREIGTDAFMTFGLNSENTLFATEQSSLCMNRKKAAALSMHGPSKVLLRTDGTLDFSYNFYSDGEWVEARGWSNIVQVDMDGSGSAEFEQVIGLKSDGTLLASGNNDYGQCNVSGWSDIVAVQTFVDCTIGKKADGTYVIATNDQALARSFNAAVNKQ